jgi:LuxR family maltose regulon positive regulatory protein
VQTSGTLIRTGYNGGQSPWASAARAAIESGDLTEPFRRGDHDTAARTLADLTICLAGSSFEQARVDCLELLALVEACRGRLRRAQELTDAAGEQADELGIPAKRRRAAGHLARAWVATERQELSGALHWLDRAGRLHELRNDPLLASLAALLRARLMRDRGNPTAAHALLAGSVVTVPWVEAEFETEKAQLASGGASPSSTSRCLEPGPVPSSETVLEALDVHVQSESSQVQRLLARAERECCRDCSDDARALTLQALVLAESEQLRRPFRHAGPRVRALIRADAEIAGRARWLSPAGHLGAEPLNRPRATGLPDQLTERELEVLRHLAALLSTQEIAAAMFISVNTVRTHVRHILDKLVATRRNEAVRRARELGLV